MILSLTGCCNPVGVRLGGSCRYRCKGASVDLSSPGFHRMEIVAVGWTFFFLPWDSPPMGILSYPTSSFRLWFFTCPIIGSSQGFPCVCVCSHISVSSSQPIFTKLTRNIRRCTSTVIVNYLLSVTVWKAHERVEAGTPLTPLTFRSRVDCAGPRKDVQFFVLTSYCCKIWYRKCFVAISLAMTNAPFEACVWSVMWRS